MINGSTSQLAVGGMLIPREVDSKTLEKLSERSYYKDYLRLGTGCLSLTGPVNSTSPANVVTNNITRNKNEFRTTSCNSTYQLCRR